jgi:hypothetical protein
MLRGVNKNILYLISINPKRFDKNVINDYNEFLEDVKSERKDDVQDIITVIYF